MVSRGVEADCTEKQGMWRREEINIGKRGNHSTTRGTGMRRAISATPLKGGEGTI